MNFKKKMFMIIAVLISILVFIIYNIQFKNKDEYSSYRIEKGSLQIQILATGTVQPENRLQIKPPIAGRAEAVLANEGEYVEKGTILAWLSSTERAALLDAAKSKGALELKKWQELYRATPVISPITGTIISKNIETGQSFTSNDSIYVMSNRLTIKAQVDETDIAKIFINQKVAIILDAYPDTIIEGKVSLIAFDSLSINNVTTYIVDILPFQIPSFMRSGMTVNVNFLIKELNDILLVPASLISFKNNKSFVLVKEKNKYIEKELILGLNDGKFYEVLSGILENELIYGSPFNFPKDAKKNPFAPNVRNTRQGASTNNR